MVENGDFFLWDGLYSFKGIDPLFELYKEELQE